MTRKQYRRLKRWMPWIVLLVLLLIWEIGCALFRVPRTILPRPSLIAASLYEFFPVIMEQAGYTLFNTLAGFTLAAVLGLVFGMLIGSFGLVYAGLYGSAGGVQTPCRRWRWSPSSSFGSGSAPCRPC